MDADTSNQAQMPGRVRRVLFVVAVFAVVGSCSSPESGPSDPVVLIEDWPGLDVEFEMALLEDAEFPAPEILGECIMKGSSSYAYLSSQFARTQSWYFVEPGEWTFSLASDVRDLSEDQLSGRDGIPLNGLPGEAPPAELEAIKEVSSFVSILTRASGESRRGAGIYVPLLGGENHAWIPSWVVSVRPDGEAAFVGNCANTYWGGWEAFVGHQVEANRAASAADLVGSLTSDEKQAGVLADWLEFNESLAADQ